MAANVAYVRADTDFQADVAGNGLCTVDSLRLSAPLSVSQKGIRSVIEVSSSEDWVSAF